MKTPHADFPEADVRSKLHAGLTRATVDVPFAPSQRRRPPSLKSLAARPAASALAVAMGYPWRAVFGPIRASDNQCHVCHVAFADERGAVRALSTMRILSSEDDRK